LPHKKHDRSYFGQKEEKYEMSSTLSHLWHILRTEMSFDFKDTGFEVNDQEVEKDLQYGIREERFIQIDWRRS